MTIIALIVFGVIALSKVRTSLIPNVQAPRLSIFIDAPENNAREIQRNVVSPLKETLLQVEGLKDFRSEAQDGIAQLFMEFEYGRNIDLAFIETNEKIDFALPSLPNNISRPIVVKSSASDIPAVQIVISDQTVEENSKIYELSDFVFSVVKKRIEQLPEIAIADISGYQNMEIRVVPEINKLNSLGLKPADLADVIKENNLQLHDLRVLNGNYEYRFRISNSLTTLDDLRNLVVEVNNHVLKLRDICDILEVPEKTFTKVYHNWRRSVVIAVIKKSDAEYDQMDLKLDQLIANLEDDYPTLTVKKIKDQSRLLHLALRNLKGSLLVGCILAISIMFWFTRKWQTALIIGAAIPIALLLSILILYLFGISINMISLSGLILGVGMMIDNSIIVVDNITQEYVEKGNLMASCVEGTNMIISPLTSSVLSTCSVFLPLVFLSGITGALFYDQAMAVSICLFSSFLVSIIFIPLCYLIFHRKSNYGGRDEIRKNRLEKVYERLYDFFHNQNKPLLLFAASLTILGFISYSFLVYSRLPDIKTTESQVNIDWNENINAEASFERLEGLFSEVKNMEDVLIEIGPQQFLVNRDDFRSNTEVTIYLKTKSSSQLVALLQELQSNLNYYYPNSNFIATPVKNVFDFVFGSSAEYLTAKIYSLDKPEVPREGQLFLIDSIMNPWRKNTIPLQDISVIEINNEQLILNSVDYNYLINDLRTIFNYYSIDNLNSSRRVIPIRMGYGEFEILENLKDYQIRNNNNEYIPISNLIKIKKASSYKKISSDKIGEYLGYDFKEIIDLDKTKMAVSSSFFGKSKMGVRFGGEHERIEELYVEFVIIILVSIALLYLIMAAQFESLLLPFVIMLELPIDIGASFIGLYVLGETLNVMSGIGIVVMCGIIINDSILKIHTIRGMLEMGLPVDEAVKTASKKRLKPIVMTTLTTNLALLPFILIPGLGSDLQKPLAIVVIIGLTIGTFVSIFLVPIFFKVFYKITNGEYPKIE